MAWRKASGTAFVTALPASPVDGQEVFYQSTTAGTGGASATMESVGAVWHLRYRAASSSAYKWEFVGGAPVVLRSTSIADESTAGGIAAFADAMTLSAPLQGQYEIHVAFRCYISTRTTTTQVISTSMGVRRVSGSSIIDDNFTLGYLGNGVESGTQGVPQLVHYAANSATLTTQLSLEGIYRAAMSAGSGVVRFQYREIGLTPIRVTG